MRLAAVEIYNEISGYWLWPLDTPDMDDVIDKSMKRAARLVSKDYRAPVKVQCCGFTIFRCCCRAKNPKSSLLNTIFDGIEDREMDIRETRQVGNYIESGERRWEDDDGSNLLEDRAYEADRRFGYLEDGRRGGDRYRDYDRGDGDYGDDYTESSASMYSRGQRTKESGSYTREIAGGSYAGGDSRRGGSSRRSAQSRRTEHSGSRGTRSKRSGRSGRGGQSLSETLTRSEVTSVGLGWDEASESQFG